MIADELLAHIRVHPNEFAYLDLTDTDPEQTRVQPPNTPAYDYRGALLHIDGRNRHLVYRIHEYSPLTNTWSASWPD